MKKAIVLSAGLSLLLGAGALFAHDEPAGGTQVITGEVVDLACYLGSGERGPNHRECAEKCISSGLPVGIKTTDTLYIAITGEHGPANAKLASLASKTVEAEGTVSERDGVHLIAIKKVTAK